MEQFKNQFDVVTVKNIIQHVAITAAASLVVALSQYLLGLHFGSYDFIVLPLLSSIVSAAKEYNKGA